MPSPKLDTVVKITTDMVRRWDSATGNYEAEQVYVWHYADGRTFEGFSWPGDDFAHLIEPLVKRPAIIEAVAADRNISSAFKAAIGATERAMEKLS